MRRKLEKITGNDPIKLPTFLVKFCYNRAVVSTRIQGNDPRNHKEVYFAPFFFVRVMFALIISWYQYKE